MENICRNGNYIYFEISLFFNLLWYLIIYYNIVLYEKVYFYIILVFIVVISVYVFDLSVKYVILLWVELEILIILGNIGRW